MVESDLEQSIPKVGPPIPLRDLLVPSIIYPVACYAVLGYLDISLKSLLPLFFSTPIRYGGLGLSPSSIGLWLGLLGFADGIFQLLFLAKLVDRMGPKRLFCTTILWYIPLMLLFPLMSWIVQTRGVVDAWIYACLVAQLALIVFWDIAFGTCVIERLVPIQRALTMSSSMRVYIHHCVRAVKEYLGDDQWDGSDLGGDRKGCRTCDGDFHVRILKTAPNLGWACGVCLADALSHRVLSHLSFSSSRRISCKR